jgi:glucosamine--fructose-6-phosphate aminotransferase (isomerizing)
VGDAFPTTDSVMYQTIHRQPADASALLEHGWTDAEAAATIIAGANRIWLTGIGTSYHAALVGGWLLRFAGKDARAVTSFDFATYPNHYPVGSGDAVVLLAHTGVKSYSARALERAAAQAGAVISIGSESAEHPGSQAILRTCIRETSAAYTSSHLCAQIRLAQLAVLLGAGHLRDELLTLPDHLATIIARFAEIEGPAREAASKHIYAIGAGPNEPVALEFVIKAREAALQQADGLGAEQYFHGPIVPVDEIDYGIAVIQSGPALERTKSIIGAVRELGAPIWTTGDSDPGLGGTHFGTPPITEALSPLLNVVPIQIFAYHLAAIRGTHPDRFRREDPVYANAFGLLTL